MNLRQTLLQHRGAQTLLVVVLALLLNHLSSAWFLRVDLTHNQRHSLSTVAQDSVRGLKSPIQARVYFSEGLEPPFHDHRRALLDKLAELAIYADQGLDIVVQDPASGPAVVAEAQRYGVRPLPYAFRSWDRTEARTVWMGVTFLYGDRQVAVDALPAVEAMEAELIGAIRHVTTAPEDVRRIGWLLGHGEFDPTQAPANSPLVDLWNRLGDSGSIRTVAPGDSPIPPELDGLLVVAPRRPFHPAEIVHLDQYLMNGGTIALWLTQHQPDFERDTLLEVDHGLKGWLAHHGVTPESSVLLDRDHTEQMVVPVQLDAASPTRQLVRLNYPLALTTTNLTREARPVRELPRLLLPFASPLALPDPWSRERVDALVWARTMPGAVAVPDLPTLDPRAVRQPLPGEQADTFPVAVALAGSFESWLTQRELPARLDPQAEAFDPDQLVLDGQPTRMVVVGSGDALVNNLDFAENVVDWLVEDPALIAIRSRSSAMTPLTTPSAGEALRAKLITAGVPLLLLALIAGLITARQRSR